MIDENIAEQSPTTVSSTRKRKRLDPVYIHAFDCSNSSILQTGLKWISGCDYFKQKPEKQRNFYLRISLLNQIARIQEALEIDYKSGDFVYVATDTGKQSIAQVQSIWDTES